MAVIIPRDSVLNMKKDIHLKKVSKEAKLK
jgi:hypothetical protein